MTNKYGETLNGKITIYKVVNALYNYYLSKDSTHIDAPESAKNCLLILRIVKYVLVKYLRYQNMEL